MCGLHKQLMLWCSNACIDLQYAGVYIESCISGDYIDHYHQNVGETHTLLASVSSDATTVIWVSSC